MTFVEHNCSAKLGAELGESLSGASKLFFILHEVNTINSHVAALLKIYIIYAPLHRKKTQLFRKCSILTWFLTSHQGDSPARTDALERNG